ncbi:MAG: YbaK/EbsC family protein [Patescibacteria group bacterium]
MVLKPLLKFLNDKKIKYEIIKHKTVYTAIDSAGTQHVKPEEIVKTLIMKLDNKYALALISANKNLDKNKFKKAVNVWVKKNGAKTVKKIEFAKELWMKKNINGSVGATPPFGELIGIPTFSDASLLKQKNLFINTGDYEYSIKLTRAVFEKTIGKEIFKGNFSKKK